jgi:hypothetical protein
MSEAKGTGDAERAVRARRPVLYEKLLRAKLAVIRDEAMELQAALEFVHGDDALEDSVGQFADRTVRHSEEIMANTRGELSLPEPEGELWRAKRS